MNAYEMLRSLQKITPDVIRELGVASCHFNEKQIVSDSIEANTNGGKTFLGYDIDEVKPFTDWFETGEFHENLKFLEEQNIEFTSSGDGFEAIKLAFKENQWIAPSGRTLDEETLNKITIDFIKLLKQQIQLNNK